MKILKRKLSNGLNNNYTDDLFSEQIEILKTNYTKLLDIHVNHVEQMKNLKTNQGYFIVKYEHEMLEYEGTLKKLKVQNENLLLGCSIVTGNFNVL